MMNVRKMIWKRITVALTASLLVASLGMEAMASEPTPTPAPIPESAEAQADEKVPEATPVPVPATPFDTMVVDGNGIVVKGYTAPQDGVHYLFMPASVSIKDMQVSLQGSVTGVSKGTYDPGTKILAGAFAKAGDTVTVHLSDRDITLKVMQSNLPSLQIELRDTTLASVWADKDKKYQGNSLYLTDPQGRNISMPNSVEFKGRGNSSWREYAKKPYQIKLAENTSVLSMEPSKKWVLLANAGDDSLMRNAVAYDLAQKMNMPYTPEFQYVDLWIDGVYQGNYLICDKVEIGKNRVNLKNEFGVLMEWDDSFYYEEENWFADPYFNTHFTVKDSVSSDKATISSAMTQFQQALTQFADYLYNTPAEAVSLETLATMIDVDSFAKYYLMTEYTLNREANYTSFYWYRDGAADVLHIGPVWDYDTCMGNEDVGPNQYFAGTYNALMNRLLACPAFYKRVQSVKSQFQGAFSGTTSAVSKYSSLISKSAEMNYIRWNTLGSTNPKGFSNYASTFSQAVSNLKSWLSGRNGQFTPQKTLLLASLNDDRTALVVTQKTSGTVCLAMWSAKDGQDDLRVLQPTSVTKGVATFEIPVSELKDGGLYYFFLHKGGNEEGAVLGSTVFSKPN